MQPVRRHSITRALSKIGELLPPGWSFPHFRDHTGGSHQANDGGWFRSARRLPRGGLRRELDLLQTVHASTWKRSGLSLPPAW